MKLLRKIINLKRTGFLLYSIPQQEKEFDGTVKDRFVLIINGNLKQKSPVLLSSFVPKMYSSLIGWEYDIDNHLFPISKIKSEYSEEQKVLFNSYPELKPVEYLRIPTMEGDITLKGDAEFWVNNIPENYNLFVKTKNAVGFTDRETKYEITSQITPKPYQDFFCLGNPSAEEITENSDYTFVNRNNNFSDNYNPLFETITGELTEQNTYS